MSNDPVVIDPAKMPHQKAAPGSSELAVGRQKGHKDTIVLSNKGNATTAFGFRKAVHRWLSLPHATRLLPKRGL